MTFYQKNKRQEYSAKEMQMIRKTLEEEGYNEKWYGAGSWIYLKDNKGYVTIYHPYKLNYSLVKVEGEQYK
jgi:hypothetical protein